MEFITNNTYETPFIRVSNPLLMNSQDTWNLKNIRMKHPLYGLVENTFSL